MIREDHVCEGIVLFLAHCSMLRKDRQKAPDAKKDKTEFQPLIQGEQKIHFLADPTQTWKNSALE